MHSTTDSYQCDFLDRHSFPCPFVSERAELAHIEGQLSSLANHIAQLNSLQTTLLRRSRQLHNSLSPIHSLPVGVLSHVFKQLVDPADQGGSDLHYFYWRCLRQAVILGSVSSHFRRVAFGTPELWRRVPLRTFDPEAVHKALLKLHHCTSFTPNLDISLAEIPGEEEVSYVIDALLTPDITPKVRSLDFCEFSCPPSVWIEKFATYGSLKLTTTNLWLTSDDPLPCDIRMLTAVTQLDMYAPWTNHLILLPESLQYLTVNFVEEELLVSLLYQCPNLVECKIDNDEPVPGVEFTRPLILPRLKRLVSSEINVIMSPSSVQNLHLPSLEFLDVGRLERGALLLYSKVSVTLTTLTMTMDSDETDYDDPYQLQQLTFPKLAKLEIDSSCWGPALTELLD